MTAFCKALEEGMLRTLLVLLNRYICKNVKYLGEIRIIFATEAIAINDQESDTNCYISYKSKNIFYDL